MRVIAGSAKRARLVAPAGSVTRPTTDRVKETLFNMIGGDLSGCVFLDLFSGSGAIGIEALSRGAERAVLVERDRDAVACIRKNLAHVKLAERALVMSMDVMKALKELKKKGLVFDVVFLDPPYGGRLEEKVLKALRNSPIINDESQIILETSTHTSIDYLRDFHYYIEREKTYKTNRHIFLATEKEEAGDTN